jgi:hypothetical protein
VTELRVPADGSRIRRKNATYDVLPGGGFIMLRGDADRVNLTVMVNWLTEINRRERTANR